MVQLYDQFNRPIPAEKAPDRRPLAVAPLIDAWRDYVASGLTPKALAALFREADAGDVRRQSELFDQIEERDGHILGETSKRRNVILDVEFRVTPAADDARSQRVAEFVAQWIDGNEEWPDVLVSLQDAVGKGFSALEIKWDVSSGQALPSGLEFIEQKRFLFTGPDGILRRYPLLLSDTDLMGAEIPAWKVMLHRYGGKSGAPTRAGIHRVCAWMFLFKHYAIKDWLTFAEVYGMPLRLGKYAPGASEPDKAALLAAITSLGTDAAGIISKATEIEFVRTEAAKASGDLYESLAKFANAESSKALLGQTLSAEVGDKGSYAAARVHDGVRLDLLKADARQAASTVRNQLLRPIVGFNFGWDTPVPKYEATWEESEDLGAKSQWVDRVLDRVTAPASWLRGEFGIPEPKRNDEIVGGAPVAKAVTAARRIVAKADPAAGAGVDEGPADALAALADKVDSAIDTGALVRPVETLLAECQTLEEFRDRLIDTFADMDTGALADAMASGLALAELSGRFDASEGA